VLPSSLIVGDELLGTLLGDVIGEIGLAIARAPVVVSIQTGKFFADPEELG
jgi:hypothetical protein